MCFLATRGCVWTESEKAEVVAEELPPPSPTVYFSCIGCFSTASTKDYLDLSCHCSGCIHRWLLGRKHSRDTCDLTVSATCTLVGCLEPGMFLLSPGICWSESVGYILSWMVSNSIPKYWGFRSEFSHLTMIPKSGDVEAKGAVTRR